MRNLSNTQLLEVVKTLEETLSKLEGEFQQHQTGYWLAGSAIRAAMLIKLSLQNDKISLLKKELKKELKKLAES